MMSSTHNNTAQPLSIQWIDLKRAGINTQQPDPSSLSRAIQSIINKFNDRKDDQVYKRNTKYKPPEDKEKGYSFFHYSCRNVRTSNLAQQTQEDPESTSTSSFIIFLCKHEPSAHIFALTTHNAWQVVRPYIDHSFAVKVSEIVCNPRKIIYLERRCLFAKAEEKLVYPDEYELYKTSNLYYLVESFKCRIKDNSELFKKINSIKKMNSCWVKVSTPGLLRLGTRLCLSDYPGILDLFASYMKRESTPGNSRNETASSFGFLHYIQSARLKKNELDELLIQHIFSKHKQGEEIHIHVRHKFLEDFLFSDSFEIEMASTFENLGSMPPTIQEIIAKLPHANEEEFMDAIKNRELRFTNPNTSKVHQSKLIDCLEGELVDGNDLYFKIRKMWYALEWDYLVLLQEDFTKIIKNVLIEKGTEWWLEKPWKGNAEGEKEEKYNRSYVGESGYLVFDQICPDYIEPCDILKYSEDAVYLYHVKEKFGQPTRDACSQILNAAKVIRSALVARQSPSYLQKLWSEATKPDQSEEWRKKIKTELEELGEDSFFHIFRNSKIVFVYAYLPRPNKSFSHLLKAYDKPIEEKLNQKLFESGYLDSYGQLTGSFFSTNKNEFAIKDEPKKKSNEIYDILAERKVSRSTLAKLEIVQLAQNLRNLNFEFKICEIPRNYNIG